MTKSLEAIENALLALRRGKPVILINEDGGNLILAAEKVTPENLNLLATYGRGHVCLALDSSRIDHLGLPLMGGNAYMPIDAKAGISNGSSVHDRVKTIQTAIDPEKMGSDLTTPGHVFPVRAAPGGVLEKQSHVEGAVDLARLSGLNPSAIVSEILREDGTLAKKVDLDKLKSRLNAIVCTVDDLIHYRLYYEKNVHSVAERPFFSQHGAFVMHNYENAITKKKLTAFIKGKPRNECLVRIHEGCQASESFAFMGCDCQKKLNFTMSSMEEEGQGILMYFKDEFSDMRHSEDAVIERALGFPVADVAQILKSLDIYAIRLVTNDLKKVEEFSRYGIQVKERISIPLSQNRVVFKSLESMQVSFI